MTKINLLVANWPKGTIKTVEELEKLGYSPQLLKIYSNSRWIELVARGMYKLYNDEVTWQGMLYGLQNKTNTSLHAGGKTALSLMGYSHYLSVQNLKVYFFSDRTENFNIWLKKFEQVKLKRNVVFDYSKDETLTMFDTGNFKIKISSAELAAMEMVYLIPNEQSFDEANKIMEGLTTLRPLIVQTLLESVHSVKVKRIFLFLAERNKHDWFQQLDLSRIDLGSGKRFIVKNGLLDNKYLITYPISLE